MNKKLIITLVGFSFWALFCVYAIFLSQILKRVEYKVVFDPFLDPPTIWKISLNSYVQAKTKQILELYLGDKNYISRYHIIISIPSEAKVLTFVHSKEKCISIQANPVLLLIMLAAGIERKNYSIEKAKHYLLDSSKIDANIIKIFTKDIGKTDISHYFMLFGLGEKNRLFILPNDEEGVCNFNEFKKRGEGIFLTPFQVINIFSIITNKGMIRSSKVILEGTSSVLKNILKDVVDYGDAREVKIMGYEIGGIGFESRGISSVETNKVAFVGFINMELPKDNVVIFTMMEANSNANVKLSLINKYLFRNIAYETIRYLEKKKEKSGD